MIHDSYRDQGLYRQNKEASFSISTIDQDSKEMSSRIKTLVASRREEPRSPEPVPDLDERQRQAKPQKYQMTMVVTNSGHSPKRLRPRQGGLQSIGSLPVSARAFKIGHVPLAKLLKPKQARV